MKRGFFISFAAIILLSAIYLQAQRYNYLYANSFSGADGQAEFQNLQMLEDNFSYSLYEKIGVAIDFNQEGSYASVSGKLPYSYSQESFSAYKAQMENFSGKRNCGALLDLSNMESGDIGISDDANNEFLVNYDENYVAIYSENLDRKTNIAGYSVNVSAMKDRNSYTEWSCTSNCTTKVSLYYTDNSGILTREYMLNPDENKTMDFYYGQGNEKLELSFGRLFYGNSSSEIKLSTEFDEGTIDYEIGFEDNRMNGAFYSDSLLDLNCGGASYSGYLPFRI